MAVSKYLDLRKQVCHTFSFPILLLTSNSSVFMDRTTPILLTSSSISFSFPRSCGTAYKVGRHVFCIHSLLSNRSAQVLLCDLPNPTFLPQIHYDFTHYLKFEFSYGTLQGLVWLAYYYILDPLGAVRIDSDLLSSQNSSFFCYSSCTHRRRFCLS